MRSLPSFSTLPQEKSIVPCNPALLRLQQSKSVLLLQGPVGAFYDRLASWLQQHDTKVNRVAFHSGDAYDSRVIKPIPFKQTFADWPAFLAQLMQTHQIDCVVLFGQSRRHHKAAIDLCKKRGLSVVVLEEGYFRPGFITMELDGVNGFSDTLSKYTWQPGPESAGLRPDISSRHFQKMAIQASLHYQALWKARHDFPHYLHHRISQPSYYFAYWIRSWLRKLKQTRPCRRLQQRLFSEKASCPYYFVPLQHDGDAQITYHSNFSDNAQFVNRVVLSFARHAPAHTRLVFRQHPHVRGGLGHSELIAGLTADLGISGRVFHMVEGDTPDLAEHSAGVVLINSTVGLQALERGAPLMVMGDALYKQAHLTFMGELDQFWQQAHPPCPQETASFLAQMKNLTQSPTSVYALRSEPICWDSVVVAATAVTPLLSLVQPIPSNLAHPSS
jgi:capsular polysaccharide export protein